mmetsp:Transcript_3805/g.10308  ORF Transcript_3805/g.10308 Transcript_3805/m.10308 type:complete len:189 (-) Transcript_3805:1355-1921(-)
MNCKNLLCVALLYCFYSMSPMSSFFPSAVMAYTDLSSLRGLEKPTDYGSGIEYADGVIQNLFSGYDVGLQIGLWLSGADGCDKINQGKMDGQIQKLVRYLEGSPASKIFLRIGYGAFGEEGAFILDMSYIMRRINNSFLDFLMEIHFTFISFYMMNPQSLTIPVLDIPAIPEVMLLPIEALWMLAARN